MWQSLDDYCSCSYDVLRALGAGGAGGQAPVAEGGNHQESVDWVAEAGTRGCAGKSMALRRRQLRYWAAYLNPGSLLMISSAASMVLGLKSYSATPSSRLDYWALVVLMARVLLALSLCLGHALFGLRRLLLGQFLHLRHANPMRETAAAVSEVALEVVSEIQHLGMKLPEV